MQHNRIRNPLHFVFNILKKLDLTPMSHGMGHSWDILGQKVLAACGVACRLVLSRNVPPVSHGWILDIRKPARGGLNLLILKWLPR